MSELLFSSKDRDEAHQALEKVLERGECPRAECREAPSEDEPYQVWSEPMEREPAPAEPTVPKVNIRFSDEELAKIGASMAKAMKEPQ